MRIAHVLRETLFVAVGVLLGASTVTVAQPRDPDPGATRTAKRAIERTLKVLAARPQLVAPRQPPGKEGALSLVTGEIRSGDANSVAIHRATGNRAADPWDRAVATARGSLPDYWLMVTSPDGRRVETWAPVTISRGLRVEEIDPARGEIEGRIVRRRVPKFAVRVAFVPLGKLFLVESRPPFALLSLGSFGDRP